MCEKAYNDNGGKKTTNCRDTHIYILKFNARDITFIGVYIIQDDGNFVLRNRKTLHAFSMIFAPFL